MKTKILKHRAPKRILIGVLLVLFCFTSKAQIWGKCTFQRRLADEYAVEQQLCR